MVYEDMPLAGLLTSKAENVFGNFELEMSKNKNEEQSITVLDYFKILLDKIEERILNSPDL